MPPETQQPQDHPTEPLLEAGLIQSKQIGDETNSLLEAIIQQNSENNPEPILEAQLMQGETNTNKIVEAIKDRPEVQQVKIVTEQNELADNFFRMLRGQKGEDGHTPTNEELEELILPLIPPLIPEPIKGEDGLTPTEEELLSLIVPLIPEPIKGDDGKTPTKAELRKIIEPLIPEPIKGKDGVSPIIDYKRVVKEAVKQIPPIEIEKQVKEIVEKVSQNTNESVQALRAKVASRTYSMGELSDTQSATTGQTMVKQANGSWQPATSGSGGGHTVEDEGTPLTQRTKLNFVGAGVTVTDDAGDDATVVTINGGGSSYTDEEAQDAVGSILVDSAEIDFTYDDAIPSITAVIKAGSIDEAKLDASVNDSLDLADSAVQPAALSSYELLANKATDFSTVNDTKYPTVEAVAEYVASAVVGLLDYRGTYDASTNLYPATGGSGLVGAILKGDFYIVSVAGTLGGIAVTPGDLVIALIDTPAQTSTNWDIISGELGYTPENIANKVTSISGASTNTQYPSAKLLYDQLALKQDVGSGGISEELAIAYAVAL